MLGLALSSLMVLAVLLSRRRQLEIAQALHQLPVVAEVAVRQPAWREAPEPVISAPYPVSPSAHHSLPVSFMVNQCRYAATLDENPLVIGRNPALNLPEPLHKALQSDGKISREHLQVWYRSSNREVYIRSISRNGMTVSGQWVRPHEQVKVGSRHPVDLTLGDTNMKLIFQE